MLHVLLLLLLEKSTCYTKAKIQHIGSSMHYINLLLVTYLLTYLATIIVNEYNQPFEAVHVLSIAGN